MDLVGKTIPTNDAYGKLINSDTLGVFYATSSGEILDSNPAFLNLLGYDRADLPLHVDDLIPPEYSALDEVNRNEIHRTEFRLPWRKQYIRRDGSRASVLVGVSLVDAQCNRICFAMDMSRPYDVVERVEYTQAVWKEPFDDFHLVALSIETSGNIYAINNYAAARLGYVQEELLGTPLSSLIHPDDREPQQRNLARALSGVPELQNFEIRMLCRNEDVLWLRGSIRGIKGTNNSLAFVVCADITQQKQVNEELERYKIKVRALTAKWALAEERERRLVAIGLHDLVGHSLACAKFKTASLMKRETFSDNVGQAMDDICVEIDQAIAATRDLTANLSSSTLYDLGLSAALQNLAEEAAAYGGFEVSVESKQIPKSIPQDTLIIVHRSARELLFNVVKHAQAKRASVTTEIKNGRLQLIVADDGVGVPFVGIPFEELSSPPEGFGLFSICQQIREVGGSFHISPDPRGGTQAIVTVPIEETLL